MFSKSTHIVKHPGVLGRKLPGHGTGNQPGPVAGDQRGHDGTPARTLGWQTGPAPAKGDGMGTGEETGRHNGWQTRRALPSPQRPTQGALILGRSTSAGMAEWSPRTRVALGSGRSLHDPGTFSRLFRENFPGSWKASVPSFALRLRPSDAVRFQDSPYGTALTDH